MVIGPSTGSLRRRSSCRYCPIRHCNRRDSGGGEPSTASRSTYLAGWDEPDDNQPQQVNKHTGWIHIPNRYIGVASDDNTSFQAAAELAVGDWAAFNLPLKNASDNALVGELYLSVPDCLEVEVYASTDAENITGVVRTGLNTWMVLVDADAEYDDEDDGLTVVVSVDDHCMPGYYRIMGTFKQAGVSQPGLHIPALAWQNTFGGGNSDYGYSVRQTSDGGFIIAGYTYSFGAVGSDVYLVKVAP